MPAVNPEDLRPGDGARTRLGRLLDADTFVELGSQRHHDKTSFGLDRRRPDGDGVVAGTGAIGGRQVNVYAQDRRVLGGSLGEAHADKIARSIEQAIRGGVPVVGINDSGGARIQEGVASLDGYGRVFSANVAASGRVPAGRDDPRPVCRRGDLLPGADGLRGDVRRAYMFLTGPRVVKAVTGEDIDSRGSRRTRGPRQPVGRRALRRRRTTPRPSP